MSDPLRVLVVCTGNICRSPVGELLLANRLGPTAEVASAGTHALVGHGVDDAMVARLPGGVDASAFAARQLTPALLRTADLVIGMSREHRARAVELAPATVRRAFTLRELARVLSLEDAYAPAATPGEWLRAAIPVAGRLRQRARADAPEDDDIVDPYRRADAVFDTAYVQIDAATAAIARAARA